VGIVRGQKGNTMYANKIEDRIIRGLEPPRKLTPIEVSALVLDRADAVIQVIAETSDPVVKNEHWEKLKKMVPPAVFIDLRMRAFVKYGTTE